MSIVQGSLLQMLSVENYANIRQHLSINMNKRRVPFIHKQTLQRQNDTFVSNIPKIGDSFIPQHLVLTVSNTFQLPQLNELIFELSVNGVVILLNTLSFFTELQEECVFKGDDKIIINLMCETVFKELHLYALQYAILSVKVHNVNDQILNATIYSKFTHHRLSSLVQSPVLEVPFHLCQSILNLPIPNTSNTVSIHIPFFGLGNGYFIQTNFGSSGVSTIQRIQLTTECHPIIDFDEDAISLYCNEISNNMLYVPLNGDIKFENKDFNFDSSLNHDFFYSENGQSNLRLEIEFTRLPDKLSVHCLTLNRLKYENGFAYPEFTSRALPYVERKSQDSSVVNPLPGIEPHFYRPSIPRPRDGRGSQLSYHPSNPRPRSEYKQLTIPDGRRSPYDVSHDVMWINRPENDSRDIIDLTYDLPPEWNDPNFCELKEITYDHKFENWQSEVKSLNKNKNTECPISLETFKENDKYCVCLQCNYNFGFDVLTKYFCTQPIMKCPTCRKQWGNCIVYVNSIKEQVKSPEQKSKL